MLAEDLLAHVREDLLAGGAAPLGRAGAAAGAVVASAECDGKRVGRFRVADVLRTDDQAGQELFAGGNDHAHGRDEAVRVLVGVPAAALDGHGVLDARAAVGPVGDVAAFWRGITERGLVQIRKELCIYILIYIYVYMVLLLFDIVVLLLVRFGIGCFVEVVCVCVCVCRCDTVCSTFSITILPHYLYDTQPLHCTTIPCYSESRTTSRWDSQLPPVCFQMVPPFCFQMVVKSQLTAQYLLETA